ncbi:MAG TPA: Ldh family oxidoreductase [Rhodospirillales bacterium]|jgi:LDH2 family malate/lactate/ureidoglycolate dehydrogenase|nr:Ldh family oxidoreductase [Rhodospirillales bacterium]HJO69574.1 Ldh family oxidoreductase [Rhodospirillales bacterium]
MPDEGPTVPAEILKTWLGEVFARAGMPTEDAAIVADCLIAAHFRGFDTHGVPCVPPYIECLRARRINPTPAIRIERRTPWAIAVDGDNGMGHVVATRAMRAAIEAADEIGIGVASVRHSNHIGAAGIYPIMALEADCIGLAMANASPNVVPWGSREPFLGTNPVAVAVPAGRYPPFVFYMATSVVARRKIRAAAEANQQIPEGWAIDAEGRPATTARAAMEGAVLPFGGAKGSALAMLIDVLAGVLSGAQFAGTVLSTYTNQEREVDSGNLLVAMKVASFMPVAAFKQRMDTLIDRVGELPPAEGFDEVRMAGARGAALERERRTNGIPLAAGTAEEMARIGVDLGVPFPA